MRKNYVKPILNSEEFVPNQYIAICYQLKCNTSAAEVYENSIGNHPYGGHNPEECGRGEQQVIILENGTNKFIRAEEVETYWGTLQIDFYSDQTYTSKVDYKAQGKVFKGGEYLYWITRGGRYVYHHQGQIELKEGFRSANQS